MNAKSDSGECHSTGLDDPHADRAPYVVRDPHAVHGLSQGRRNPFEHEGARAWTSC